MGVAPTAAAVPLQPVPIPAYADIPHADAYATSADYRAAASDRRFAMRRFAYVSDGLTVSAYVYGPRTPGTKLPVIIFNRGSYTWPNGFAGELLTMAHRLAVDGYLVVAPLYRGSGGTAGTDEMGGADLDDLMNLRPLIGGIPGADPDRLYLYGESRGGMMVYQALRDKFPARAAAVVGGFTNLEGMLSDPKGAAIGAQIWPGLATHRAEIVRRRSAIQWPDKIAAPILIIHGARDTQVSPAQSLDMARKLVELGKPVQLILVDGEGHTISGRPADRDSWVVDWFRRH
jgi:dipeptidyl aminopeptidase/acylaminoacyl peptidase